MSFRFTLDDVAFLAAASDEIAALAPDLALSTDRMLHDLEAARRRFGDRAAAVVETVRLRRAAVPKLGPPAAGWLFTDEALQQATPGPVAAWRAHRLAGVGVHDVTCSIGADLAALGGVGPVLGSDLDPVRARMCAVNTGLPVVVADALRPVSRGLLAYADPARRSDGRRILTAATIPGVSELDEAWAGRPPVLRVPPGIDYDALHRPGEVEIVSVDGSVREAVLWPAELATVGRRATVLTGGAGTVAAAPRYQLTDADPDDVPVAAVGRWLVDPDPAVVRAHLVRHFAARHDLWQLDPHLAYLSGDEPPPFGRAFRVLVAAPFRERTVGEWLRRDGVGTLEIKVRGLPVVPDELRLRLRKSLTGPRAVQRTLVLARIGRTPTAYFTEAVEDPGRGSG